MTSEAFTIVPDVVYSPIVPVLEFVTNRSDPDTAIPAGLFNPETREGFDEIIVPGVAPNVYSPIQPPEMS